MELKTKIRRAERKDIPAVIRVFRASRRHSLPYLPEIHSAEEDLDYFENRVFASQEVFLAEEEGNTIGFIAFDKDWLHHLYLLPEAQGKNIGAFLLRVAQKNSRRLQLWVFRRNRRAIQFYERHGFRFQEETDGAGNEEKEPDARYEWRAGGF